ncbi:MAG: hypothetical protein SH857_07465 [Chitinophagales bacterium]|nr:hypothetical protein [Chitinophagales bacterium]
MTKQISDILICNEREYYLNRSPLEPFFKKFADKKLETKTVCTALWRGYFATYEIKDNQLYVRDLEILSGVSLEMESILGKIFPNNGKYEWYSGLIRIDDFRGEFDEEEPSSMFEFLEILKGDFIKKRTMSYEELQIFKKLQFDYFKRTEEYQEVFSMWKNNNKGMEDSKIDETIAEYILNYTREVFAD